jgi:hypothetical protein
VEELFILPGDSLKRIFDSGNFAEEIVSVSMKVRK